MKPISEIASQEAISLPNMSDYVLLTVRLDVVGVNLVELRILIVSENMP